MTKILIYKCDVCGSEHKQTDINYPTKIPETVRNITLIISPSESLNTHGDEIASIKRVWCLPCLEKENIPFKEKEEMKEFPIDDLIRKIVEEELDDRA